MSNTKIEWEDLPEDLKQYFDEDGEIEFETFIESNGEVPLPITAYQFSQHRLESAKRMLKHRRYVEEMKILYDKYENGKLPQEEAEKLMNEARQRYNGE